MRTIHYRIRRLGVALLAANCALIVSALVGTEQKQSPNFDTRHVVDGKALVLGAEREGRLTKLRQDLPPVRVDFDAIVESPRWIASAEGFLSGPDSLSEIMPGGAVDGLEEDPHRTIKRFLNRYRPLFGHDATVLTNAWIYQNYVSHHNGMRTTIWMQHVAGIRVLGGTLVGHVTRNGELINLSSTFLPDAKAAAGDKSAETGLVKPPISAPEALLWAGQSIGEVLSAKALSPLADSTDGP